MPSEVGELQRHLGNEYKENKMTEIQRGRYLYNRVEDIATQPHPLSILVNRYDVDNYREEKRGKTQVEILPSFYHFIIPT